MLSSIGRTELLQTNGAIQKSSAELEAVHSRVQDLYKDLQETRQSAATSHREELAALATCLPDEDSQVAQQDAIAALMADVVQLQEMLQTLRHLKPQLDSQVHAGPESPGTMVLCNGARRVISMTETALHV